MTVNDGAISLRNSRERSISYDDSPGNRITDVAFWPSLTLRSSSIKPMLQQCMIIAPYERDHGDSYECPS